MSTPKRVPFARERITVSNSGGATPRLTRSVYEDHANYGSTAREVACEAMVEVIAETLTYTMEGTTPTLSVGQTAAAGDVIALRSMNAIQNFRALRSGGTDAVLEVVYYK